MLKVDYISDSTTNVGRALKMESVMSSFRLLMAENNSYVKLAFLQLNLYMVTSICARARELHLYKLKVDYISDSTTNIERTLKMESVMSSFRLFIDNKNNGNV